MNGSPIMRIATTLTGRTRWRTERRLLKPDLTVLQVEVRFGDGPSDWHGLPTHLAGTGWRDATVDDVTRLSVTVRD